MNHYNVCYQNLFYNILINYPSNIVKDQSLIIFFINHKLLPSLSPRDHWVAEASLNIQTPSLSLSNVLVLIQIPDPLKACTCKFSFQLLRFQAQRMSDLVCKRYRECRLEMRDLESG